MENYQINKTGNSEKISLVDDNIILSDDKVIAETFRNLLSCTEGGKNPLEKATLAYRNHASIQMIEGNFKDQSKFSFTEITEEEISNEILSLNSAKASQQSDFPTNILKNNVDIYAFFLQNILNKCLNVSVFPDAIKIAEVTPVFKKRSNFKRKL